MTVSSASIPVLHSVEVVPCTHKFRVFHVARVCKALRHYRGEWLGIHYDAFTKFH
jgi:hypothetical protein